MVKSLKTKTLLLELRKLLENLEKNYPEVSKEEKNDIKNLIPRIEKLTK